MRATGSSQRMPRQSTSRTTSGTTWQRRFLMVLLAVLLSVNLSVAKAEDDQGDQYDRAQAQHPELFKVYYDENVLEYCGLLTHESALGFAMRRDDLLAARPLSDADKREVRIAGAIAADKAYGSHGLAQSAWCKGEGMEAFNRFVERYRATPYGTATQTE